MLPNEDGSINSADNPAAPGSVVTLYATGTGPLSPLAPDGTVITPDLLPQAMLSVSAVVGGAAAAVLYAGGAPGIVEGILQVNVEIPGTAAAGSAIPLVLQAGGRNSQLGITVAIGSVSGQTAARRKDQRPGQMRY